MSETGFYSAVTAAAIGGAVSLLALAINAIISGWRDRVVRQRQEFSKAFAACVGYEEFPFVVRRRRSQAPQDERVRISSELSIIQRELAYYSAWLATESRDVSTAYETLVAKLREIAGGEIREAWLSPPIDSDRGMNMPDLGLSALRPLKEAYLSEVAHHLSWVPRPVRRLFQSLGQLLPPPRAILWAGDRQGGAPMLWLGLELGLSVGFLILGVLVGILGLLFRSLEVFSSGIALVALGIALRSDAVQRSISQLEYDEKLAVVRQYTSAVVGGGHPDPQGLYYDLRAASRLRSWIGSQGRGELRTALNNLRGLAAQRGYTDMTDAIDRVILLL